MIEILTLAASVTKIAGAVSSGIKAGKDISSLLPAIGKLGELDAQIQIAETGKHKGVISKLTNTEQEALAITQAKLAHKRAMDELRTHMMLFCEHGTWETFTRELALARKRKADHLKLLAQQKRKREMMLAVLIFVIIMAGIIYSLYEYAFYIRGRIDG